MRWPWVSRKRYEAEEAFVMAQTLVLAAERVAEEAVEERKRLRAENTELRFELNAKRMIDEHRRDYPHPEHLG